MFRYGLQSIKRHSHSHQAGHKTARCSVVVAIVCATTNRPTCGPCIISWPNGYTSKCNNRNAGRSVLKCSLTPRRKYGSTFILNFERTSHGQMNARIHIHTTHEYRLKRGSFVWLCVCLYVRVFIHSADRLQYTFYKRFTTSSRRVGMRVQTVLMDAQRIWNDDYQCSRFYPKSTGPGILYWQRMYMARGWTDRGAMQWAHTDFMRIQLLPCDAPYG